MYKIKYKKIRNGGVVSYGVKQVKIKRPCTVIIPTTVKDKFVTDICENALRGIDCIGSVVAPGARVDDRNGLSTVILPSGLMTIGRHAFAGSSINKLVLPRGVKYIEWNAFEDCSELTSVTLNDGLQEIDMYAFKNTPLDKIDLPASLYAIDGTAVEGCSALSEISVADDSEHYRAESGCLIDKSDGAIVVVADPFTVPADGTVNKIDFSACVGRAIATVDLPEQVECIGSFAFSDCKRLESVVIRGAKTIEDSAFDGCSALREVTLPACLEKIESMAFDDCNALKVIRFGGTREKWKELTQDVNILWRSKTDRLTVVCSDGEMPFPV